MFYEEFTPYVAEHMHNILRDYEKLRGLDIDPTQMFWDAVIISASDFEQKKGYELQIFYKQQRNELPLSVPFHVFSDPPGYKIGCGGSTLFTLNELFNIYKAAMFEMRFLLIPAGGYSQRLPNLCVLGKLFCPLPFEDKNYQMLDLILASYIPLLKRMPPGIFLASSDAIISFHIEDDDDIWTFHRKGFTALAHPSPVEIGISHGVYVLPSNNSGKKSTFMSECVKVLQKPTVNEMKEKGAIVKLHTVNGDSKDTIFSDSAFFFTHDVTKKLIAFYQKQKPLKYEISSYGDFLQPLGTSANPSYIVSTCTSKEMATLCTALYGELFGINLHVLVLKHSFFHHLGTMEEYVQSLSGKGTFSHVFGLKKASFNSTCISPIYIMGTIIHSFINPLSIIPESTVLEYCDINIKISVGHNCIISNVQLTGYSIEALPTQIPDCSLFHTVTLNDGYVTIACSIYDNIKETYTENAENVCFFKKKLKYFIKPDDIKKLFDADCKYFSLWHTKIFPICNEPETSFKETLNIVSRVIEVKDTYCDIQINRSCMKWMSMSDILTLKDSEKMITYQMNLFDRIKCIKNL